MEEELSADRPLDRAWWQDGPADDEWIPSKDAPILAPYDRTRAGFELIIAKTLKGGPGWDCFPVDEDGLQRINLWDIWKLDEDLAEGDQEKQKINDMQLALGALNDDDRYIRIQIACLQRCFWTFPANVDLVLSGIAGGHANVDAPVSCEPPWSGILTILRHRRGHPAPLAGRFGMPETDYDPLRTRQVLIRAYIKILTWWTFTGDLAYLKQDSPEHADLAETIYRRLGPPNKLKRLHVGKLRAVLSWQAFPNLVFEAEACKEAVAIYDATIRELLDGKEDEVGREIGLQDACHHAFFRHADHQITNIGAGKKIPLAGAGQERTRICDAVTSYVHSLGSWLAGRTPGEAVSIWPASEEVMHRVSEILGESSPRKHWLTACLWKKLKDNQAHHGCGALDEQPDRFALPPDTLKA